MTQKEIIQNNKLIAEFMGLKPTKVFGRYLISKDHCHCVENTEEEAMNGFASISKYNISWDWLMPVVEKIENLEYWCIIGKWTSICSANDNERIAISSVEGKSKIMNAYHAIISFIMWYNKHE